VRWILVLPVHTGFYENFEFLENVFEGHAHWHDTAKDSSCGSVSARAGACVSRLLFYLSHRGRNGYCSKIRDLLLHLPLWTVDKDITLMRKYCSRIFGCGSNSHFQVIFITRVSSKFFSVFHSLGCCNTDEANNQILGRGTGTSASSLRNRNMPKIQIILKFEDICRVEYDTSYSGSFAEVSEDLAACFFRVCEIRS